MSKEFDVNRMKSSPMTNVLVWLTEEGILTEKQADEVARPLFLTLQNHYVRKDEIGRLIQDLTGANGIESHISARRIVYGDEQ